MKRYRIIGVLIGFLSLLAFVTAANAKSVKADICHIPPGNPANAHFISVGERAVAAHVANHGDEVVAGDGSCTVGVGECIVDASLGCSSGGLFCDADPTDPPEITELSCDDGLDNDCDGLVDDADEDCAAPAVFMNLPLVSEWTDLEVMAGEIPADPWGSCEEDMAARAALVVEFADGTSGAVLYSDLSAKWNRGFPNHAADFADGFFDSMCRDTLHGIGQALTVPMAWASCSMKYASNFDLDYTSRNGSHFRATTFGWDQATFRHYCGD